MSKHAVLKSGATEVPVRSADDHSPDNPSPTAATMARSVGRRLSDRVRAAWRQACVQGRAEIAARLLLCCQAIEEEEARFTRNRREGEVERRNRPLTTRGRL